MRREPRTVRGLLVAPLAAPMAVMAGSALFSALSHSTVADAGTNKVAAVVIVTLAVVAFSAPLAYGATLILMWPAVLALRALGWLRWWSLSAVMASAGGVLFPWYLHLLSPQGTFDFFPGAGFVAGAAIGLAFWFIALHGSSADDVQPG
jgi:hypothetical protein